MHTFDRQRLTSRRRQVGLSISELSRRAGCTHGAISRIEAGTRLPRPATAKALADVLGIDVNDLWITVEETAA